MPQIMQEDEKDPILRRYQGDIMIMHEYKSSISECDVERGLGSHKNGVIPRELCKRIFEF